MSKKEYAPTKLPGGIAKIIQVCEDLRVRNTDGYLKGSLWLAKVKSPKLTRTTKAVVCSPLTGNVISVAFDPTYPRDDLNGDPYRPLCNGGTEPLPHDFYDTLNGGRNSAALIKYGLGKKIKNTEMRRGDLAGIDWDPKGGHSTFVWDVHLNAKGEVDCFQILGSHGSLSSNGFGLHIHGCTSDRWFKGKPAKPGSPGTGNLSKAKDKIFVDEDEIVRLGTWYLLPGVKKSDVDVSTFRVTPKSIGGHKIAVLDVGRINYDGDLPTPYCMKGGPAAPPPSAPTPPGHVDAPVTTVKKAEVKKDPDAVKKVEPKKAVQDDKKTLMMQRDVETAMQEFFHAKWIDADPGIPDDVNDAKSQAAVKAFQKLFGLKVDAIVGKHTRATIKKQLPAVQTQVQAEDLLHQLFVGGKLTSDPGSPNGFNDAQTAAAIKEFQKSAGLKETGVPDADTQEKLKAAIAEHAPSEAKHGLNPLLLAAYWLGNVAPPGGSRTLRVHSYDVKKGQELQIFLKDAASGKEVEATVKLKIAGDVSEVSVPVPAGLVVGAIVFARVKAAIDGGKTLELPALAPLFVRGAAVADDANWRPYIGKDAVPDAVIETIRKNRAKYGERKMTKVSGKYAGEHHYDYKPGSAHIHWARSFVQKKIDAASGGDKMIARAFMVMLDREGLPASLQTYDNQIVTWGVGLGGKGDGIHVYEHLNKDADMKKRFDDIGLNFDHSDYHVVDLRTKKVVSSGEGQKGNDNRHIVALEAWRQQMDLLSAVIGLSEDEATRDGIAESQWLVYIKNSTKWPGQDKVHTLALYFMITHLHHWLPAIAKRGFNVEKLFAATGGGAPSIETDKQVAVGVARGFVRYAKEFFADKPHSYEDVHDRTKSHVWRDMRADGKKENFDPGELTYDF
ncbi:MAG TPA: peptidoglycan-binding domain-containing protein [Myxococcota bacterium]|jgi:peptidoglycan hydrolase-like protein with peptidoglycan-binding domain|nr:peptidoglycan-binding domain-containing protein [Myxococcota bacterium]